MIEEGTGMMSDRTEEEVNQELLEDINNFQNTTLKEIERLDNPIVNDRLVELNEYIGEIVVGVYSGSVQAILVEKETEMIDEKLKGEIQAYINYFRSLTARYLPADTGQKVGVVAFNDVVLIDITLSRGTSNFDNFHKDVNTMKEAFNSLNRKPEDYLKSEEASILEGNQKDKNYSNLINKIVVGDSIFMIKARESEAFEYKKATEDVDGILRYVETISSKQVKPNKPSNGGKRKS
jgi:hypothetical protein